jgi:hypothetical protein
MENNNNNELNTLETFSFEIYTKNPVTGETGWDIKFVRAFGKTKKEAINWLKNEVPHFDEIITSTASDNGCHLNEEDLKVYASGRNCYEVTENLVN